MTDDKIFDPLISFDPHGPSTMVSVAEIVGIINIKQAFPLLPMYRFTIESPTNDNERDNKKTKRRRESKKVCVDTFTTKSGRSKKWKCPWPGEGGHIVSGSWGRVRRGIIRPKRANEKKDCFPGCAMLDVSVSTKNVNLKVMNRSMQLCGATSVEMAREAACIVLDKMYQVQSLLDLIQSDRDAAKRTIQWILSITKGQLIDDGDNNKSYSVDVPMLVTEVPGDVDTTIGEALLLVALDYKNYSNLKQMFEYVLDLERVIEDGTVVGEVKTCMFLYTKYLGYSVNRGKLHKSFCYWCTSRNIFWVPDGFKSMYSSTTDDIVCIYYYFDKVPESIKSKIHLRSLKDRSIRVSIKIPASGKLNFSGPCPELIGVVYDLFREFCQEMWSTFVSSSCRINV